MKAIQTFWTNSATPIDLMNAGWPDPRFHFMSWALSACILREQFNDTALFTDQMGKDILIDALKLPYKEVFLTQQGLHKIYPERWWVMRKIHTYSQVRAPFIHVDSDAFLWNGLSMTEKPVIVQNVQYGFPCYNIALRELSDLQIKMPNFFNVTQESYDAVNMGIVGGTDYHFFQEYVAEVQHFYSSNLQYTSFSSKPEKTAYMNSLIEECFFYQYAALKQKPITPLLTQQMESNYTSIASSLNDHQPITHLIGQNKKNLFLCKQMEFQLKSRFPETYLRVVKFVRENLKNQGLHNSYNKKDPFLLSNYFLGKGSRYVNPKNVSQIVKALKVNDENQVLSIVCFEKTKHIAAKRYIKYKSEMRKQENKQSKLAAQMATIPLALRLKDKVAYNPECKLFKVKYPSRAHTTHSSLVYDFGFDCEHISHYNLDDLSLFLLQISEKGIHLDELIDITFSKIATTDSNAENQLIRKIDLKIKELVLLGLLLYTP